MKAVLYKALSKQPQLWNLADATWKTHGMVVEINSKYLPERLAWLNWVRK